MSIQNFVLKMAKVYTANLKKRQKVDKNNSDKKVNVEEIIHFLNISSFTYDDFVEFLNYKQERYFNLIFIKYHIYIISVERKKIKKYSQSENGLYVHHVAENFFQNLNNENAIAANPYFKCLPDYGFKYQMPNQLVYCNLVEHTLLHLLIKVDNFNYFKGYDSLNGKIKKWFINGVKPNSSERKFYNASKIGKEEAENLEAKFCEFIKLKRTNNL